MSELTSKPRPYGPNQITELQNVVFKSRKVGDELVRDIDSQTAIRPSYRQAILGAMSCFDLGNVELKADRLKYCESCEFGLKGSRTLCTEHHKPEDETKPLGYVVLPANHESYVNNPYQSEIVERMLSGIDALKKEGYREVRRSDIHQIEESSDSMGFEVTLGSIMKRDRQTIQMLIQEGIKIPDVYAYEGILKTDEPLIAKHINSHRGELKFLLNTNEQKSIFLSWLLLCAESDYFFERYEPRDLTEILMYFKDQFLNDPEFDGYKNLNRIKSEFKIEEFIQGPSLHASSYRIVSSGFGDIVYSECLISPKAKYNRKMIHDHLFERDDPINIAKKYYDKGSTNIYRDLSFLLTISSSPLFLDTYDVVSNYARGSKAVKLDGKKVVDDFLRKQLLLLGINPDCPVLPSKLEVVSKRIALENKYVWPYVGIDMGTTRKGDHFLLEINRPPALIWEVVEGAHVDMDQLDLQNLLLRNIARSRRG